MIEEFEKLGCHISPLDGSAFFFLLFFQNPKSEKKKCYHTDMESLAGNDTEGKGGQPS